MINSSRTPSMTISKIDMKRAMMCLLNVQNNYLKQDIRDMVLIAKRASFMYLLKQLTKISDPGSEVILHYLTDAV